MGIAHQGDIIKVEKIKPPVLVVSKDFFNESGEIIGCPIIGDSNEDISVLARYLFNITVIGIFIRAQRNSVGRYIRRCFNSCRARFYRYRIFKCASHKCDG